jgi:hypothetical protein
MLSQPDLLLFKIRSVQLLRLHSTRDFFEAIAVDILISYLQNHLESFWNGLIIDNYKCNLDELNFGRP